MSDATSPNAMTKTVDDFIRKFIAHRHIAVLGGIADSQPIVCSVFYVVGSNGEIYFKSRTDSMHSRAFMDNPRAGLAIYDHESNYDDKTGVQLIGLVSRVTEQVEMQSVVKLYSAMFGESAAKKLHIEELLSKNTKSTMFRFDVCKVKLVSHELEIHMPEYEAML